MYKQILRKLIFITATALSLVAFSVVHKSYASDKEYAEDRIIVKYKDNVNIIQQQVINIKNKTIEYTGSRIRGTNSKVLKINSKTTVEEVLEKYANDTNIEYAELDYKVYPARIRRISCIFRSCRLYHLLLIITIMSTMQNYPLL